MIDNQTLSTIAISASAVLLAKLVYDQIKGFTDPLRKIPGPPRYPLIDDPALIWALFRSKRHEYVDQMVEKYGDVVKMDFIGPAVLVVDANEAKRILNTSQFVKNNSIINRIGIGILNNALFALPTGENWKKHRKLLQPAFGPTHLRHAGKVAEDAMKDLDHVINKKLQGNESTVLDFTIAFKSLTLDVISMVGFNHNFGSTKKLEEDIEWGFTKEEIYGELVGFYFAGHETTSATMGWALYELCQHPEIAQKLYQEIKNVNLDDPALVEQLFNYKYLDKFIKEVQRTHSIVNGVQRVAVEDTEILGYKIPKGTRVIVGIASIHMSEKYYKEPHKFNPDRWDEPHVPGSFIPFGDGQHNCIGQKMAIIEAKVFTMHLLQNYNFKLVDGFKANGITRPTLRLEHLPVIISKKC
ncbi:hypothetical protein HK103_005323 [Boothiomyces macroporosus]|uniref:Cytochrome P450 n=1 Tax=Boothiomyces macroporosus TaxID=261099 RepID=A0AAD5YAS8_9FUNG|nr:hypothetical protein HK103_005323 [Boothiomyces macroporosus]